MPNYDYRCNECDHRVELFVPVSRRNEKVGAGCEKCNSGGYVRVFRSPSFEFVGDGFDSTRLSQDQIDMTPEFWEDGSSNPKVKVIK